MDGREWWYMFDTGLFEFCRYASRCPLDGRRGEGTEKELAAEVWRCDKIKGGVEGGHGAGSLRKGVACFTAEGKTESL